MSKLQPYRILFSAHAPMSNIAVLDAASEDEAKDMFLKLYQNQFQNINIVSVYAEADVENTVDQFDQLMETVNKDTAKAN